MCVGFFVLFFIFHTVMLEILCYSFVAYRKKEKPQKQNVIANIKKINPHRLKHFFRNNGLGRPLLLQFGSFYAILDEGH